MNKKVLITGINGFTGTHLEAALSSSRWDVVKADGLDLLKRDRMETIVFESQPDAVIHLAGIASPAFEDHALMFRVNVEGTFNLTDALKTQCKNTPETFVFASSAHVYGRELAENSLNPQPLPTSNYGISKYAAERIVEQHLKDSRVVTMRLFNYTGVGQTDDFVIPKIVNHYAEKNNVIKLGTTSTLREYNDVRWIADTYVGLLDSNVEGTLDICTGQGVSLDRVMQILEDLSGHSLVIEVDESLVRADDPPKIVGNPGSLRSILPESEPPGIAATLEWMYQAAIKRQ